MISNFNLALALLVTCTVGTIAVPVVQALSSDTDEALAVKVTAVLRPGSVATFESRIARRSVTLTCSSASTGFTASTGGPTLGPFKILNPAFGGCTDSLGGSDTLTTSSAKGSWTATFIDVPGDGAGSASGDTVSLGIPRAGLLVSSSKLPGCTITVASAAATSFSGAYDDRGVLRYKNASLPYTFEGRTCSLSGQSGAWRFGTRLASGQRGSAGFAITPPVYDVS